MEAVILHGGQGTRLRPLTHTGPKQLIKVAGKPVSQWVLEQIRDAGIRDVIIVLGDNAPTRVVEYYGDGSKFGVRITYVYQGKARGLADAVYKVKDVVSDKFLVYLGTT
ncbi:glucose-1-phosphate thymidylyltransferase, N-terminal fragment [Saccharolobus solfataricus]|uniref:Glucose-1-phosphate thymidylyltransferase, N-terminal n=1 Tax=Saccharolobus solfataricus TaxID=2287 RepID=A0A157SZI3_SACSO|nr:glucose-1-phosphate thymidylyltransferase, N-terminal fragment [Saccharolobus solfataricus]